MPLSPLLYFTSSHRSIITKDRRVAFEFYGPQCGNQTVRSNTELGVNQTALGARRKKNSSKTAKRPNFRNRKTS